MSDSSKRRLIRVPAGLGLAAALGLVLMALSFARLIGDMHTPAFDMSIIAEALTDPIWHTRLAFNFLLFVLALLLLHLGFGLVCWLLALLSEKAFPAARCPRWQWTLAWAVMGAIWLMVANAAHFAHSSLGEPYHAVATTRLLGVTLYALLTACMLAGVAAVLFMFLFREAIWRRKIWLFAAVGSLAVAGVGYTWKGPRHGGQSASRPPNVIFLGVDSLRPDFVNADTAPHIRAFMDGAVQLQDAVTPLARTFPAWISILSGKHPHTTGAYMNLLPRELIHTGATLPQILRENGYSTYYSMDETRFANIDASYGFDHTMTSTIGGSDFVISWFADTPLSNVVMNTRLGALLFPHVHANRAANVTYDPDAFVRRVARALDPEGPLFLVSHLTLPHWPYNWAASDSTVADETTIPALYTTAVRRADQQFGDMLAALQRRGVLDNAIVVALSDHGEALGRPGDFMADAFPAEEGEPPKSQKWGHGTSVFSPTQYRVVLGIHAYGSARALLRPPSVVSEPVSLIDLAPTILDLLKIGSKEKFDGISLASLLRPDAGADQRFNNRIRFTETEYNPQGFLPTHITTSALAEAMQIYQLDSATDRLLVRKSSLPMIMASRQYAALLGKGSMAIAIPDPEHDGKYDFIQPAGATAITAEESSVLRQALQERFGIQFKNAKQTKPAS